MQLIVGRYKSMLASEIKCLDDIADGASIHVAPAGGAAQRFIDVLKEYRPDIEVISFLDTYRTGMSTGTLVQRIDQSEACNWETKVIVVVEREDVRNAIAHSLHDAGFRHVHWIGIHFSLGQISRVDDESSVLYFFYDLSVNALNYEYLIALGHADAEREKRGLKRLHPVVVPQMKSHIFDWSRQSIREEGTSLESDNYWFLHNVIVPSAALLASCSSMTLCGTRDEAKTLGNGINVSKFPPDYNPDCPTELDSIRLLTNTEIYGGRGYGQPFLSRSVSKAFINQWLTAHGLEKEKVIVITLRQNGLQKMRNSNFVAWNCFAEKIRKKGFVPVFVKDTYSDFEADELGDYLVFHPASWNILLRMALYEIAYLNLTVNSGTVALCALNSNVRYLNFIYVSEEEYVGSKSYHETSGTPVGSQYPGSTPYQRWVWGGGSCCETILDEFNSMCVVIENAVEN